MSAKTKTLRAFHGKASIKKTYLARVKAHRLADELIKGSYWQDGKGCAVGCTIHGSNHARYETELGIPQMLARIEDGIFEGLGNGLAQAWPERFLSAIKPGADLSEVGDKFLHWLLVDPKDGVIRFAKTERSKTVIQRVGDLYGRKLKGATISHADWRAAAAAAYAAYAATAYATAAAAAAYAAYAAAAAAAYAAVYAYAYAYARQTAREKQANKLIRLLRAAK